jgi:hypothetical protein
VVRGLADLLTVVRAASPADKAQIYTGLGLRLTYQPGERLVRTEAAAVPSPGARQPGCAGRSWLPSVMCAAAHTRK